MHRLPLLARLICTQPSFSDAGVARSVGRTARTVSRYRRVIASKGSTWLELEKLSALELDQFLNAPRYRPACKSKPDADSIQSILDAPGGSLQKAWEKYLNDRPEPHIGLSHFCKKWRRHRRSINTDCIRPQRDPAVALALPSRHDSVHIPSNGCGSRVLKAARPFQPKTAIHRQKRAGSRLIFDEKQGAKILDRRGAADRSEIRVSELRFADASQSRNSIT